MEGKSNRPVAPARGGMACARIQSVAHERPARRRFLQWGLAALACGALPGRFLLAAGRSSNRPSTSRASRQQAIDAIPFQYISEPMRSKLRTVVNAPTIYRRMPIQQICCDADLYVFLIRNPEIVVNMWQVMGVTKAQIKRTGAYAYDAGDGAGTVAKAELVYGTRQIHLFFAEGYYDGPLAPHRITGRSVLLLTSSFGKDRQGRSHISSRLDAFVQMDGKGIEILAKTLHPLLGRTADFNFTESTRFLSQISRAVETNGSGIQRLTTRLKNVDPNVRAKFANVTAEVNQRAVLRTMAAGGQSAQSSPTAGPLETTSLTGAEQTNN